MSSFSKFTNVAAYVVVGIAMPCVMIHMLVFAQGVLLMVLSLPLDVKAAASLFLLIWAGFTFLLFVMFYKNRTSGVAQWSGYHGQQKYFLMLMTICLASFLALKLIDVLVSQINVPLVLGWVLFIAVSLLCLLPASIFLRYIFHPA